MNVDVVAGWTEAAIIFPRPFPFSIAEEAKSISKFAAMGDEQGYIGVIQVVEPKYPTTVQGGKQQSQSYEWTSRVNNEDKQSGSYQRISKKEKVSRYEPYKEWNSGRVGVKDEVVRTSKVKVGDQNGFTEYYSEERVRNVTYNNKGKAYFNKRALKDY